MGYNRYDDDDLGKALDAISEFVDGISEIVRGVDNAYRGTQKTASGYRNLRDSTSRSSDYYLDYSDDDDED
mgnify:FL=1